MFAPSEIDVLAISWRYYARDCEISIEPDGRFTLTMNQEGDGATIGVYRVVVSDTDPRVQTKNETHLRVTEGQAEYLIDLK
jgi:hypothetical protein